jgi:Domain of unknown function (DUF4258)
MRKSSNGKLGPLPRLTPPTVTRTIPSGRLRSGDSTNRSAPVIRSTSLDPWRLLVTWATADGHENPANGARGLIARFSVYLVSCLECDQIEQDGASKELTAGPLPRTIATDGWIRNSRKGPSVLVLEHDKTGKPIHVVWGIPKGHTLLAVVATAYRPDPTKCVRHG